MSQCIRCTRLRLTVLGEVHTAHYTCKKKKQRADTNNTAVRASVPILYVCITHVRTRARSLGVCLSERALDGQRPTAARCNKIARRRRPLLPTRRRRRDKARARQPAARGASRISLSLVLAVVSHSSRFRCERTESNWRWCERGADFRGIPTAGLWRWCVVAPCGPEGFVYRGDTGERCVIGMMIWLWLGVTGWWPACVCVYWSQVFFGCALQVIMYVYWPQWRFSRYSWWSSHRVVWSTGGTIITYIFRSAHVYYKRYTVLVHTGVVVSSMERRALIKFSYRGFPNELEGYGYILCIHNMGRRKKWKSSLSYCAVVELWLMLWENLVD